MAKINGNGLNGEQLIITDDKLRASAKPQAKRGPKPYKPKLDNSPQPAKTGTKPPRPAGKKEKVEFANIGTYRSIGNDGFSYTLNTSLVSVSINDSVTVTIVDLLNKVVLHVGTYKGVPHVSTDGDVKVTIVGANGGTLISCWTHEFRFRFRVSAVQRFVGSSDAITNSSNSPTRISNSPTRPSESITKSSDTIASIVKPTHANSFVLELAANTDEVYEKPMTYFIEDGVARAHDNKDYLYAVKPTSKTLRVINLKDMTGESSFEIGEGSVVTTSYTLTKHNLKNVIAAINGEGEHLPLLRLLKNLSHKNSTQ